MISLAVTAARSARNLRITSVPGASGIVPTQFKFAESATPAHSTRMPIGVRVKDSVEYVWWLSKTPYPKADNRKVLSTYSKDMIRLNKRRVRATTRPGGYIIKESFADVDTGGSIPPNVIEDETPLDMLKFGNNAANDRYTLKCKASGLKIHPARFPAALPDFFIRLLTDTDDIVVDPFAGSNTLGMVAEKLGRRWIAVEMEEDYLCASKFRFDDLD